MSHNQRRPKRPPSVDSTPPGQSHAHDDNTCTLCNEAIQFFAIGHCDHPICYKCSTRMRMLCDQMYCAICRADIPRVLFIRKLEKFDKVKTDAFCLFRAKGFSFEDETIRLMFFELLENRCKICQEECKNFKELETHMRRKHELKYCELCVENLKLFSHERKFYDRKQLAEHKRIGDPSDTSYRMHPLCKFCDVRYFDNDELLRHLRKDHYYCHFCETDGINNEYFQEYSFLRDHFREKHFLCEEDECAKVEFLNAFRSDIDFKAHISSTHSKNLGRQQARQLRNIEFDFNYGPRPNSSARRPNDRQRGGATRGGREDRQGGRNRHGQADQRNRTELEKRSEVDAGLALSMTLAEAQGQGSVCVMNSELAQHSRMLQANQNTNVQAEKSEFKASTEDFPLLFGQEELKAKTAAQGKEVKGKETKEKDSKKNNPGTLAQVLASGLGMSVRNGQLCETEFPSLISNSKKKGPTSNKINALAASGNASKKLTLADKLQGKTGSVHEIPREEDFKPVKGGRTAALAGSMGGFHKSQTAPNLNDFPSLQNSSNTAQVSATWVKNKDRVETVNPPVEVGKGVLKMEVKKGKQKKTPQDAVGNKWLNSASKGDVENVDVKPREVSKQPVNGTREKVKSLADIAFNLAGNYKNEAEVPRKDVPADELRNSKSESFSDKNKSQKSKNEKSAVPEKRVEKKESNISPVTVLPAESATDVMAKGSGKATVSSGTNKVVKDTSESRQPAKNQKERVKTPVVEVTRSKDDGRNTDRKSKVEKNEKKLDQDKETFKPTSLGHDAKSEISVRPVSTTQLRADAPEFQTSVLPRSADSAKFDDNTSTQAESIAASDYNVVPKVARCLSEISSASSHSSLEYVDSEPVFSVDDFPTLVALPTSTNANYHIPVISDAVPVANTVMRDYLFQGIDATTDSHVSSALGLPVSSVPPPGFASTTAAKPPPGFSAKPASSKPPPGFSQPAMSDADNNVLNSLNISSDLNNLLMFPQTYIPPNQFQERSAKLAENVLKENTEDTFSQFKQLSLDMRRNLITASEFYSKCSEAIGSSAFKKIFPELVALLPDIKKQQELLLAHRLHLNEGSSNSKKSNPWSVLNEGLLPCSFCGQVILSDDSIDHMAKHGNWDFPVLLK